MTINFKHNSDLVLNFNNTLVQAGIDNKEVERILPLIFEQDVAKKYIDFLKNPKSKALIVCSSLSYGKYLKSTETCKKMLENIPTKHIQSVVKKLRTMTDKRVRKENDKYNFLMKIFHKIGQFFQGHGFNTKGEYGYILASYLESSYESSKVSSNVSTSENLSTSDRINLLISYLQSEHREFIHTVDINSIAESTNQLFDSNFRKALERLFKEEDSTKLTFVLNTPYCFLQFFKELENKKKRILIDVISKKLYDNLDLDQAFKHLMGQNYKNNLNIHSEYIPKEQIGRIQE